LLDIAPPAEAGAQWTLHRRHRRNTVALARSGGLDTIGAFRYRDPKQPLVTYWRPYPSRDATAVFPDGRVIFVRATDYRVEVWRDRGAERDAARRAINVPDNAFPQSQPPIAEDRATLVDPTGRIWVARTFAAPSADRLFDVFNDRAQLVARVTVKNRGRVIGFGKSSVYVVTPDEDDVEWIERYAMPALPRS
jgi:hypothetical protein